MSAINLSLRKDYKSFSDFVTAAKASYPTKNVLEAIKTCTDMAWKVTKQVFVMDPRKPLYAHLAEALEKAILKS